jgi:hypothetical protein
MRVSGREGWLHGRRDRDVLDRTIWCSDLLFTLITLNHGCRCLDPFPGIVFRCCLLTRTFGGDAMDRSPFDFGMPAQWCPLGESNVLKVGPRKVISWVFGSCVCAGCCPNTISLVNTSNSQSVICGCEMWSMHLLSQCLFDHGSSDMMHTSSQRGGVCVSPCCFEPLARHAHDERVLIWCGYPRKELRMVHGVPAVVSLLRVEIKHPWYAQGTEEGFGIVVCHPVIEGRSRRRCAKFSRKKAQKVFHIDDQEGKVTWHCIFQVAAGVRTASIERWFPLCLRRAQV